MHSRSFQAPSLRHLRWLMLLTLAAAPLLAQDANIRVSKPTSGEPCCAFLGVSGSLFPPQRGSALSGGINADFTLQDGFSSLHFQPVPLLRMGANEISGHWGGDFEIGYLAPIALSRPTKDHPGIYVYPEGTFGVHAGAPYRWYGQGGVGK